DLERFGPAFSEAVDTFFLTFLRAAIGQVSTNARQIALPPTGDADQAKALREGLPPAAGSLRQLPAEGHEPCVNKPFSTFFRKNQKARRRVRARSSRRFKRGNQKASNCSVSLARIGGEELLQLVRPAVELLAVRRSFALDRDIGPGLG